MDFSTELPPIHQIIYNGVLDQSTIEYKTFQHNLTKLIALNKEGGHIPDVNPPDHLLH